MKRFMIIAAVLLLTATTWNVTTAENAPRPVIMISEVMASNDSVATYPKAGYTDWVEIFNSGDAAVDLSGWGLSDNPEKPLKWQFPDGTTIHPGEYRVILCDKDTEKSSDAELHASFTISRKSGEIIALTDAEGTVHDRITLPEMKTDISFGRRGIPRRRHSRRSQVFMIQTSICRSSSRKAHRCFIPWTDRSRRGNPRLTTGKRWKLPLRP